MKIIFKITIQTSYETIENNAFNRSYVRTSQLFGNLTYNYKMYKLQNKSL